MPRFLRLRHANGAARRITPAVALVGLAGTAVLTLGLGASLSGLVATITNNSNTVSSASLAIQETSGAAQCNSYDTTTSCGTINKYGGQTLIPGGSTTTTITMKNAGTVAAASATLAPAACSAAVTPGVTGGQTPSSTNTSATNLCSVINVAVYKGSDASTTPIYNGTAAAFTASLNLGTLAAGATQPYTFVVTLSSGASTATQGQTATQNLVWTYNQ